MRIGFFFLLILLSFKREVSAKMQFNRQNNRNNDFMVNDDGQHGRYVDDDPYEEESTKWNIDLSDMLNFDSSDSESTPPGRKPLTREDLKRLIRASRHGNRYALEELEGTPEYDEAEINALLEEDEELKMQVRGYLLRYVNLFLNLLEVKEKQAREELDDELVDFDFVISWKDLRALQDLAENFEDRTVFDQLYVIDTIISKGIRLKKQYSFYDDVLGSVSKTEFSREFFISKTAYFYIVVGVAVTMIMAKTFIGLSYRFIGAVMINNMILMEGLFNYFRKVKEADIADSVDRMKYGTEYDACNPEGQSIFGKLYDMFYENQCLSYHKNMQLSRADSIFPLESILNAYSFYLVEIPCKVLGSGINAFVVSVNAYLPMVARQLGEATTQFTVMSFLLLLFILYFFAPQFSLNFFGNEFRLNFGRFLGRGRGPEPGNQNPRQYRRIRGMTKAALNEPENNDDDELDDNPEDSDSYIEEIEDFDEQKILKKKYRGNSMEDGIEILQEHAMTDEDEFFVPVDKDSSDTEGLPSDY